MPCCAASAAATASLVDSGFDPHSARSAPPAFNVNIKLAVSLVTCRQALSFSPLSGCSLMKRCRMSVSTGISLAAQSIRSCPSPARFRSLTSLPFALTFKRVFSPSINELTHHFNLVQPFASVEKAQLDEDVHAEHDATKLSDQLGCRGGCASGGKHIIHYQHCLTRLHRVLVNLELVDSVFQLVVLTDGFPGQLAGLADGHEPRAETQRDRAAGDETTR